MQRKIKNSTSFFFALGFILIMAFTCWISKVEAEYPIMPPTSSDKLLSSSVGKQFYEIARALASYEKPSHSQIEQAIILLTGTIHLDPQADYAYPLFLELACAQSQLVGDLSKLTDRPELVHWLLIQYMENEPNLNVVRKAICYLLEQLNTRDSREALLNKLLEQLGGKSRILDSELATLLGRLSAEKADWEKAKQYFVRAYNSNKCNKLAFAKLLELAPERITPQLQLEHLILRIYENPLDIETALELARQAEQLPLYSVAAQAYEYCADLFKFLHPDQPLPAYIYLPWAINSYNAPQNLRKCLQIREQLQQDGQFDLFVEAIAGKAAAKIGDHQRAKEILFSAEETAQQIINSESEISSKHLNTQKLAWFYCFGAADVNKALDWANKAYSSDPNSATAAALLAYALVMNEQMEWAKLLIDNYEDNQISELAAAKIQLAEGQRELAIQTLKSAIARDPGALEAEQAKEILAQQGSDYIHPAAPETVLEELKSRFGQAIVPKFISPEKIISVQLNTRGSRFSYGNEFEATLSITNNSPRPLIISEDGAFKGNIRIDANISGDINKEIPHLISVKWEPGSPIRPGRSAFFPIQLITGELKRLLLTHPQASVNIEFIVYLDPIIDEQGRIITSAGIKPVKVTVERPGIELTTKYLQNRLQSLTKGQQGQRIKTAQLFIGLLMEQAAFAKQGLPYKFKYADWMPAMLKSALLHNLTRNDWVVKAHIIAGMLACQTNSKAALPLDHQLISAVADNLNDTHWPIRLLAVYLLAQQDHNFDKVLKWVAKYDTNELVRDMAIALQSNH